MCVFVCLCACVCSQRMLSCSMHGHNTLRGPIPPHPEGFQIAQILPTTSPNLYLQSFIWVVVKVPSSKNGERWDAHGGDVKKTSTNSCVLCKDLTKHTNAVISSRITRACTSRAAKFGIRSFSNAGKDLGWPDSHNKQFPNVFASTVLVPT